MVQAEPVDNNSSLTKLVFEDSFFNPYMQELSKQQSLSTVKPLQKSSLSAAVFTLDIDKSLAKLKLRKRLSSSIESGLLNRLNRNSEHKSSPTLARNMLCNELIAAVEKVDNVMNHDGASN